MTLNLDSGTPASGTFTNSITVHDSLGNEIPLTLTFTKALRPMNGLSRARFLRRSQAARVPSSLTAVIRLTLTFGADGKLTSPTADIEVTLNNLTTGASDTMAINWDVYDEANGVAIMMTCLNSPGVRAFPSRARTVMLPVILRALMWVRTVLLPVYFPTEKTWSLYQLVSGRIPKLSGANSLGKQPLRFLCKLRASCHWSAKNRREGDHQFHVAGNVQCGPGE